MKTPKAEDLKLKSVKLFENNNVEFKFYYRFSQHNETHTNTLSLNSTLRPDPELNNKVENLKDMVLQCEEMDYVKELMEINGFKDQKEVQIAIDACLLEMSKKIKVTGITISGKPDNHACVISYRKTMKNEITKDHKTEAIDLEAAVYGFESELKDCIEAIRKEAYYYLYNGKHFDYAQTELYENENYNEK